MNAGKLGESVPEWLSSALSEHLLGLQHIGFVVADLDTALADLDRLYGLDPECVQRFPEPSTAAPAHFAFVRLGGVEFEFIEPRSQDQKALLLGVPSAGAGLNHLAWRVRDLDGALAALAERGIVPGYVTPGGPVSLPDKRMVYLDPETTGGHLVELIERDDDRA